MAEYVTVFRSAENSGEAEAVEIRDRLESAGVQASVVGDDAPGVVIGTWEVRVPAEDRVRAEKIAAEPAAEPEDEEEVSEDGSSHDLDFVSVFSNQGVEAEMEAISIKALLDSSGIPAVVIGSAQIPSLPFEVRVPKSRLQEAVELLQSDAE